MKKRLAIIVTWFGNLPDYFPVWLKSAEWNEDVDFYLFCDQDIAIDKDNICYIKTTLEKEVDRISNAIGEKIEISSSYKFCDLRIYFGVGYADFLKNYEFWGYCDIDLVFGRIRHFLTDEILDNYDRIYEFGHLSIFRNNVMMNYLYELPGGIYTKEEILRGRAKCTVEEHFGINRICNQIDIPWYRAVDYCDFDPRRSDLHPLYGVRSHLDQVFVWIEGKALCIYIDRDGALRCHEFVYMHWQKKKPTIKGGILGRACKLLITAKYIEAIDGENISNEFVKHHTHVLDEKNLKKERILYFFKKMMIFLQIETDAKKIWLRQMWHRMISYRCGVT